MVSVIKNAPTLLVFCGAVMSAFGVLWAALRSAEVQGKLNQKTDQIEAQNREISRLNSEIRGMVTGGDSFCYIRFQWMGSDQPMGILIHNGKYPLYDVSIRLWQIETLPDLKKTYSYDQLMSNSKFSSCFMTRT